MLDKFKIGQRVKVIKRIYRWSYNNQETPWDDIMDNTIGKVYPVIEIHDGSTPNSCVGYRLDTSYDIDWAAYYPEESLKAEIVVGEQLLFSFMEKL